LLQRVEKIAAEGKEAAAKVTCQADLDHEAENTPRGEGESAYG